MLPSQNKTEPREPYACTELLIRHGSRKLKTLSPAFTTVDCQPAIQICEYDRESRTNVRSALCQFSQVHVQEYSSKNESNNYVSKRGVMSWSIEISQTSSKQNDRKKGSRIPAGIRSSFFPLQVPSSLQPEKPLLKL